MNLAGETIVLFYSKWVLCAVLATYKVCLTLLIRKTGWGTLEPVKSIQRPLKIPKGALGRGGLEGYDGTKEQEARGVEELQCNRNVWLLVDNKTKYPYLPMANQRRRKAKKIITFV